jgi:hypothetical protein
MHEVRRCGKVDVILEESVRRNDITDLDKAALLAVINIEGILGLFY